MRTIIVLLLCMGVAACAQSPTLPPEGGPSVPAPAGYVDYCLRHPERLECGGDK